MSAAKSSAALVAVAVLLLAVPSLAVAHRAAVTGTGIPSPAPPQTLSLTGPGATVATSSATFSFASSETGSSFLCSLDGQTPSVCRSPATVHNLTAGQHTFQAWAVSPDGQQDPTGATWNFTVQFPPPHTLATGGPTGTITSSSTRFHFASSQRASTFLCSLDGQTPSPCTSPQTVTGLANGQHTFQAWAVNASNAQDPTGASWSFIVAVPPPQTRALGGPTGTITTTSARFHFASSQPASTFLCSLDGQLPSACTSPETVTGLANGQHTFQAWAVSPSGEQDPTGATWTFTVQAPPAVITPPSLSAYVARVGQPVTCQAGSWTGGPAISYRWYRDGSPITGPQSSGAYTPQRADAGQEIGCQVQATNSGGTRQTSAGEVQVEQFMLLANLSFPAQLHRHRVLHTLPTLSFVSSNTGRVHVNLIACGRGCSHAVAAKTFTFITGINRLHLPSAWRRKLQAGTYRLILRASTPYGDQQAVVALHVAGATVAGAGTRRRGGASGPLPAGATWGLNADQRAFALRLAQDTGLDAGVVAAWVASEEPASAWRAPNGADNWLNIGCWDAGHWAGGGAGAWRTPAGGADATSSWLHGHALPGVGYAALGIREILLSAGASPTAQIQAIQRSPWASSHYPNLGLTYRELEG